MSEIVLHYVGNYEWRAICPRPGCYKKELHLGINTDKKVFGCVKCGWGGTLARLKQTYSLAFMGRPEREEKVEKDEIAFEELDQSSYKYLEDRGISPELVRFWNLCQSPSLPFRVVFPWPTYEYWAARTTLPGATPKYMHPKGRRPEKPYGAWRVGGDSVVVVEGPIDAIKTPGSVAVLGHNISDDHITWLNTFGRKIIYFDSDVSSERYKSVFKLKGDVYIAQCEGGDPGSKSKAENLHNISNAKPLEECSWL